MMHTQYMTAISIIPIKYVLRSLEEKVGVDRVYHFSSCCLSVCM